MKNDIKFDRVVGKYWKVDKDEQTKTIQMSALLSDQSNDFLAYIKVPP